MSDVEGWGGGGGGSGGGRLGGCLLFITHAEIRRISLKEDCEGL